MAYVPKQIPDDQENLFGRTEPTTPIPQGGGSAGEGGNAAPGVGTSTQFGSNAAKLTDYLNANQEQVAQFGQDIAGDLTNKYQQTMGGIDQGVNEFNQQVGSSYTPPDQTKVNSALQDPAAFAKDPNNLQQWQNWYNPQYGGPQNFESSSIYSNLNNQVNQAVDNAGLTNTMGGLGTYINKNMGANDTTEGMRTLDSALLQRNPNASKAIREAADPYKNLSSYLGTGAQKAAAAIEAEKGQVAQGSTDIRNQTKGVTDKLQKDLQDRLGQTKTAAQAKANAFKQAVTMGNDLTDDELKTFGIDKATWSDILKNRGLIENTQGPFTDTTAKYGERFDLTPYLQIGNPDSVYNIQNVANPDEYAREQALQMMTQNQFNLLPDDASQAGKAPLSLAQFNSQGAGQDVKNKLRGLDQSVIDQYKNWNLGAYDTNSGPAAAQDPRTALSWKSLIDIYNRNEDLTNPTQKGIVGQLQQWLDNAGPGNGLGGGGDAKQPTDGGAGGTLRVIDGEMKWYDGNSWVKAPPEYRYQNPDGSWGGPSAGNQPMRFNYQTGKYEKYGDPIKAGGDVPGIVHAF